jgi:PAS domain S-box-containing protein
MPTTLSSRTSAAAEPLRHESAPAVRDDCARVEGSAAESTAGVGDRFFRQMVSSMRNGVLAITRQGAIAVMNEEACRILGVASEASGIGHSYVDVLRPHHDVVRMLGSAFELSHLPNRAELRLKATGRVIGYTLSRVCDEQGAVTGAALFFKDLTRVEQLEERERLRDRLAALGEMAASMAHELKNPLAGIEVMAGLLRRKVPESPDAQSILTDIIDEAKLANATVVEVLNYVRPVRLQTERTSLADVLHDAVMLAEGKVARGGIGLEIYLPADLPAIVGDRHQLGQVFTNLLINAFEAMDGRGRIAVTAEHGLAEDDHTHADSTGPIDAIVVQVADNGPGVPAEIVDRIFDPFFTTKAQGSGLGLAIVRKIIDAHDGRIDISSAPGVGTRFTVTLPVSGAHDEWYRAGSPERGQPWAAS